MVVHRAVDGRVQRIQQQTAIREPGRTTPFLPLPDEAVPWSARRHFLPHVACPAALAQAPSGLLAGPPLPPLPFLLRLQLALAVFWIHGPNKNSLP